MCSSEPSALSIRWTMCIQVYFATLGACCLFVEHCAPPLLCRGNIMVCGETKKRFEETCGLWDHKCIESLKSFRGGEIFRWKLLHQICTWGNISGRKSLCWNNFPPENRYEETVSNPKSCFVKWFPTRNQVWWNDFQPESRPFGELILNLLCTPVK